MEEEAKINSIGDILGSTFKGGAEYSNTTKTAIFFSFWGGIVGKKFALSTKPYSFKSGKLYVSCENSMVSQEMTLYKKEILKKAKSYSKTVELDIKDIIFGYKNWTDLNKIELSEDDYDDNYPIEFDKIQYKNNYVENMVKKIEFLSDNQKEKLTSDIKNNLAKETLKKKI